MFYHRIKTIAKILFKPFYRIEVIGEENIPLDGPLILCSNHLSLLDPIFLSIAVDRQVHWMAKKELFKSKFLAYFINKLGAFPVDRESADLSAVKNALRILKDGNVLGIFPEGTRVKEYSVENVKPGVALFSIRSKSSTIPIYIDSNYKIFSKIKITIGEPLDFTDYYNKKLTTQDYTQISKYILESIYSLKSS